MTKLNYEISGDPDGPPVVLAGSLGTNLHMWDPQLALAERFRLVRIDHRGHGGSPAPAGPYAVSDLATDVIELLDELRLDRVGFAGISIGGMVGLWLAANVPHRVDGLVAICSAAHVPNGDAFFERAAAVRAAGATDQIADAVVDRWLTPAFAEAHPAVREKLRTMIIETDPDGYAGCCEAVGGFDLRWQLAQITVPTLVISAAQDTALPVELQREIAAGIPDARLEVLEPGAHIVSVERAAEVNELIGAHLG